MPYIDQELRSKVDVQIDVLTDRIKGSGKLYTKRAGVLNYVITRLIADLYETSYTELNEAIGVLECAKQELYRRRLAPYEDKKIKENGDVY